ncbi:MAG: cytidylate kinase-like family protein [Chloroflexi bacterium]|nr:cytidylate kinase-like family protein [Chloroflexota bacterium]
MAVVTVSGHYGSGALEVGRAVAEVLQAHYVDQEILAEAARRTKTEVQQWAERDEKLLTLSQRISVFFQSFLERSAAGYGGDPYTGGYAEPLLSRTYEQMTQLATTPQQHLDDRLFLEVTSAVIKDLAQIGKVVIIGRGSPFILKDHPTAFHVFLTAPQDFRRQVLIKREQVTRQQAEHLLAKGEKERRAFISKFFHIEHDDPLFYHQVLDASRFTWQEAAAIIATGARLLQARAHLAAT